MYYAQESLKLLGNLCDFMGLDPVETANLVDCVSLKTYEKLVILVLKVFRCWHSQ